MTESYLVRIAIDGSPFLGIADRQGECLVAPEANLGYWNAWPTVSEIEGVVTRTLGARSLHLSDVNEADLLPPVPHGPRRVICLPANNQHIRNADYGTFPNHPLLFLKSDVAITGPYAEIALPADSGPVMPESELSVWLARTVEKASPEEAWQAVGGIGLINDVTAAGYSRVDYYEARLKDEHGGTETFGSRPLGRYKNLKAATPMGSRVLLGSPADLREAILSTEIIGSLDGEVVQRGTVADYFWKPSVVLSFASHFIGLRAGDVVALGTVPAVGDRSYRDLDLLSVDAVEVAMPDLGIWCRNRVRVVDPPSVDFLSETLSADV